MLINLHDDIYDCCAALLQQHRYFVIEDVIIRAGRRKLRDQVQWDVIVKWLEEQSGFPLASQPRGSLKRMAEARFNPLRVTKDVKKYLDQGNGNQRAGYAYLGWPNREATERQIAARHHVADGVHQSADRLQLSLEQIEQFKAITEDEI
jgi:hypothetical protein